MEVSKIIQRAAIIKMDVDFQMTLNSDFWSFLQLQMIKLWSFSDQKLPVATRHSSSHIYSGHNFYIYTHFTMIPLHPLIDANMLISNSCVSEITTSNCTCVYRWNRSKPRSKSWQNVYTRRVPMQEGTIFKIKINLIKMQLKCPKNSYCIIGFSTSILINKLYQTAATDFQV